MQRIGSVDRLRGPARRLPTPGRVTLVVWARWLTTGQPNPPVPPFRSGVRMRGACGLRSFTAARSGRRCRRRGAGRWRRAPRRPGPPCRQPRPQTPAARGLRGKSRAPSRAPATDVAGRTVATVTLVVSIASPGPRIVDARAPACSVLAPRLRSVNPAVTASLPPPSPLQVDDRTAGHAKIYGGRSRHWAVSWLWFLL